VPRAHIAGHSSGAAVAAQLALDDPATVRTLTLLELSLLSVPSGEECVIDGAGHLLHIQRPQPVARGMAKFLGTNSMTGD
jgi:pimeloyl-ACP methyl ester carboxylesterase